MRVIRVVASGAVAALVVACTGTEDTTNPPGADASLPLIDAGGTQCLACDAGGHVDATVHDAGTQDAGADAVANADANAEADAVADAEADAVADAVADAEADAVADAEADAVADAVADVDVDASDAADAIVDAPGATDDASVLGEGCADGTREGLTNGATYPDVAACGGTWTGDVATAGFLCAGGWHVCTGAEPATTSVQYTDAIAFPGCFAVDAAQDNYTCHPSCDAAVQAGVDTAANVDMGAIGGDCSWKFPNAGSCIAGGRIDASENSGTGCNWYAGLTGVACCRDSQ